MSTDAEKVRAAADYIERVGLFKGHFSEVWETHSSRYAVAMGAKCCTLGALSAFDYDYFTLDGSPPPLADFLHVESVPRWNDAPERTADEVVAALRSFADTLDAAT